MKPVSAAITTFNEADRIEACIRAIQFCDEIVVVDSGSTDATVEIARKLGARVEHRDWTGFKNQKAFAVGLCKSDWVILLDADEIVTPELAQEIKYLPDSPDVAGYKIQRNLIFLGKKLRHGTKPDWVLRLFKKGLVTFTGGDTHHIVGVNGGAAKLSGNIDHHSYRNLTDYFNRFNKYTSLGAAERFERGSRFSFAQNFRALYEFIERYFFRLGFIDGYAGFVYAMISSFYAWTKYAKLKELENEKSIDK